MATLVPVARHNFASFATIAVSVNKYTGTDAVTNDVSGSAALSWCVGRIGSV